MKKAPAASPKASRLLVNEAMCQPRSQALHAQPYERTKARLGHANGFKPKTLATRAGVIQFQVPQVRGDLSFYPSAFPSGRTRKFALCSYREEAGHHAHETTICRT